MKKEVNLVVGDNAISAFGARCVNICGNHGKLKSIASDVCPYFHSFLVSDHVEELWFYRGVLIVEDGDEYFRFFVPMFYPWRGCRFKSLRDAKSGVTRFLNKRR